jgi:membrane protease YdiL (CAAX protease family)
MTATSQATTPPRAPRPGRQGRWRDLMTLPPRTTGLTVVGVVGYLTVAGPGAVLLTALVAQFPLPAALVPVTGLLVGELLLCGVLLTAVATRGWWQLAGLVADRPIRHSLRAWRAPLLLLLLGLAVMVVRLAAGLLTGLGQRMLAQTSGGVVVALIVSSMLLVGFNEELLFRGLALGTLLRDRGATRLGVYQAVVTVSVLFGLAHLIRGGPILDRLELAGGTAVIGLMFAAVRLRSGSIWVGAAMHALGDGVQFVGALSVGYFASAIAHGPPGWVAVAGMLLALWFGVSQIEAYLQDREQGGEEVER